MEHKSILQLMGGGGGGGGGWWSPIFFREVQQPRIIIHNDHDL